MDLMLHIPDDIAARLETSAGELERRVLERLVAEEYRLGHLHRPDVRRLLGFTTAGQIDGFLKAHDIYDGYTLEEINQQVEGGCQAFCVNATCGIRRITAFSSVMERFCSGRAK